MLSTAFSVEEFSARRRKVQDDALAVIQPLVGGQWDSDLEDALKVLWADTYSEESGAQVKTARGYSVPFDRLQAAYEKARERDPRALALMLVTAVINGATVQAARDDSEDLFLEWVSMSDGAVRETHAEAHGQVRPLGEPFKVGAAEMPYPGFPVPEVEEWLNCRCVVRPTLASEFISLEVLWMSLSDEERDRARGQFKEYTPKQREGAHTLPDGSFPIEDCADLKNAIQAIGRAKDPAKAKTHIRSRKSALGCPDVDLPESWSTSDTLTAGGTMTTTTAEAPVRADGLGVPWYGPLVVEGQWSGDKRMFQENAITWRDFPLPLKWQKVGDDGHRGDVTVATIDGTFRDTETGLTWGWGTFLQTVPEADEALGLIAEFGRFGVSIDADKSTFEVDEEFGGIVFTEGRGCGATICAIPAFAEAWAMLGELPEDIKKKMKPADDKTDAPDAEPDPADPGEQPDPTPEPEMIRPDAPMPPDMQDPQDPKKRKPVPSGNSAAGDGVVSFTPVDQFVDVAPGRTEDGPGWLTHPVDTDRLRDYWTHGPGAAKIGWGTPGDFNRCRTAVAQYIKPQHLNGYCANRHFDALGFWPGRPVSGDTVPFAYETMGLTDTTPSPALSLVASGGHKAPKQWFADPEFTEVMPMTITDDGHIFGHLATWDTCHLDGLLNGECTAPPSSSSGYAFMRNRGVVAHDDGTSTPVAQITLGGGHAGPNLSMRAALAHYDESGVAVADISVGEDAFGIWYNGWIRPGTSEEQVTALRASALSGDWREIPRGSGNLELIAALAVNVPGFGIPRTRVGVDDVGQVSLVASGIVAPSAESREQVQSDLVEMGIDYDTLAAKIAEQMAVKQSESEQAAARIDELVAEFE